MTYIQPIFPALFVIAFVALVHYWRFAKLRKPYVLGLAIVALFLFSWPPMAWLLSRPFESPYAPERPPAGDAQAIVVLASSVCPPCLPMASPRLGSDTYERVQYAAWLHTHWRALPVLACGGTGTFGDTAPASSVTMGEALEREGVPASAIWAEERSHSTHENAVYGAALLKQRGIRNIVLVTDAYHMLRARKCFEKEGLKVLPAACGFRTYHGFHLQDLLPGSEPISWNEDIAHESGALIWYWIQGWI